MVGIFAEWQPIYADLGIATFPVHDKRPAIKNFLKMGLPASKTLVDRFQETDAFGFACRPSGITVLDVDSPDERLLADALKEFGPSPFIVRSGSGNFQAWYRHNGEKRRVRPMQGRPIDILGDGYVVAPPSKVAQGRYQIISGSLDHLADLPMMRVSEHLEREKPTSLGRGIRNDTLWRRCMKLAPDCRDESELIRLACELNRTIFDIPLLHHEVVKVVGSAWKKQLGGKNWFETGARVVFFHNQIDGLMNEHPDAFILLAKLLRHHWGREFVLANKMAEMMPGGGWRRQRFADARTHLETVGAIELIRPASRKHGPAKYRLKDGQN